MSASALPSPAVGETQNSRLQKKVQKVLSSRLRVDSEEMTLALKGISNLVPPGQNTAKNRGKLKSSLEVGMVSSNQELVDSFAKIQKQLQQMEASVSEMAGTCTVISTRLQSARQNTASLLSKTSALQQQQEFLKSRQSLATVFLQKFQLTPQEEQALDAEQVTPELFAALERINVIRSDCKSLMQHSYHQKVGLDIMESLALRLEQSYDKLYRWVQKESRELDHSPHPYFGVAFRLLQVMPIYYEHCCQDLAQSRRLLLIRRFLAALTRGAGNSRPIEMHAHEPVRYISDMLSWIHQAVASERDFLMSVLGNESQEDEVGMLLVSVFEGLGKPLKQRVSQTLSSQLGPIVAYTLVSVLEFYYNVVCGLFPTKSQEVVIRVEPTPSEPASGVKGELMNEAMSAAEAATSQGTLVTVLENLLVQARRAFYIYPQQACEKMKREPPRVPSDLSPAKEIVSSMAEVLSVLEVYSSSINKAASEQEQETQFAPVIAALLDPILQSLPLSSSHLALSSQAVYHVNVLNYIITSLKRHPNAAVIRTRLEILAHSLQLNCDCLVGQQTLMILQPSGLNEKIILVRAAKPMDVLSQLPGLSTQEIAKCLQMFYAGLASTSAMVECDRILNAQIRAECRHQVSRAVSMQYSFFYAALSLASTLYPPSMLTHTPSMVDALLDFSPPPV